ncbi:MAG: GNAT family N-acetyltransferase [Pseudonocardia sp.]|nr:GNAT family N-acetyltransferase [Pseudonocardia sp.]
MALWRVHVELEDRPGRLGELARAVGGAGCNIISLHVVGEPADDGSVTDELLVKVPEGTDHTDLAGAIEAAGIPCTLIVPADAAELADGATTALALARMVAADPWSAPQAVATLLLARLVDPAAPRTGHSHTLRVGQRQVHLGRAWSFTATELSRAAALLELAAQLSLSGTRSHPVPTVDHILMLQDGSEVRLRAATEADAPLVTAMHARCSPATRNARFLSPAPRMEPEELTRLLGGLSGERRLGETRTVLALTVDGGSAVGMMNLEPATGDAAAFSVVVEDAWQGRGLGTALVRRAAEIATERGNDELTATTPTRNMQVTTLLRRAGLRPTAEISGGMLQVRAPLLTPAAVLSRRPGVA